MLSVPQTKTKLTRVSKQRQSKIRSDVVAEAHTDSVKNSDFNELREIVKELAIAQKETNQSLKELSDAQKETNQALTELSEAHKETREEMKELAKAQKETNQSLKELSEAHKETREEMKELAKAQKETKQSLKELSDAQKETRGEVKLLIKGLKETRGELGGLSLSVSYGFENEAYRMLPKILEEKFGIKMTDRFIRAEISGREINVFGHGVQNKKKVLIIGEAKLRLDERRIKPKQNVFQEIEEKVQAARDEEGDINIVRILITHYATNGFLKEAKKRGVIVIQSFEW